MQFVRTGITVVVLAALVVFSLNNWTPVEVRIWDGLVLDTRLPALMLLSWLVGWLPMWLVSKAARWRLKRRIALLENTAAALAPAAADQPSAAHHRATDAASS